MLYLQGYEGVKPAWTRISFPFYMSNEEFNFVLDAVEFVATYGHKFLTLYNINWKNGDWTFNIKAFQDILNNSRNKLKDKYLNLTNFMQNSKISSEGPNIGDKQMKHQDNDNDECSDKYDSYHKTATFIASLLPICPKKGFVPQDLNSIDLPFKI